MAKLKKLVKENFSLVGGVVSVPAINAGYSSLSKIVKEKYNIVIPGGVSKVPKKIKDFCINNKKEKFLLVINKKNKKKKLKIQK